MSTLYAAQAQNQTTSDLYTIDPVTGTPTSVGAIGFAVTGLAWDPVGGVMYGATSNNSASNPRSIITIDLGTGAGTLVGSLGLGGSIAASDLQFTSDGQLWGIASSGGKLLSINKSTGAGTSIGATGIFWATGLNVLTDDSFLTVGNQFGPSVWHLWPVPQTGGPGGPSVGDVTPPADQQSIASSSCGPDGLIYVNNGFHTDSNLNAIDVDALTVVLDVTTLDYMDAIAWDGFFPVVFAGSPVISALSSDNITDTTADLHYHLESPTYNGTRKIEWGTTIAYGNTAGSASFTAPHSADHSVSLSGLSPSTTYHWRVVINPDTGPNVNSVDQTFTTLAAADPPDCAIDDPPDFSAFPTVTVTGTIDDNGADTDYTLVVNPVWPEADLIEVTQTLPAGSGPTAVSASVELQPNTRYELSFTAVNFAGSCDTTPPFFCIITPMPETFGGCVDLSEDFTADDCTIEGLEDWDLSSGYRVHDNALAAYEWQETNTAVRANTDAVIGRDATMELSGDMSVKIDESAGVQRLGWNVSSSTTSGTDPGYYAENDASSGKIRLLKRVADVETVLDEVSVIVSDGDRLGIRYDRFDHSLSVWLNTGSGFTQLISVVDTTYDPRSAGVWSTCAAALVSDEFFFPYLSQTAPSGPPDIDTSILFDASSYGQVTVDIFPPFSCPVGHDKYGWDFTGGNDQHKWDGPYFGGSTPHDYPDPAVSCPNWFASLRFHAYGRIDCSLSSGTNVGNDGEFDTYMNGTQGITAARIPFYMTTAEYDTELDGFESTEGAGFFTWDTDFAHKGIDAIQASLDNIVVAFAGDGAFKVTNTGDGGRSSYGVFMPVKVAAGRLDDWAFSFGRCVAGFGVVSFSHVSTTKRRGVLSTRA